MTTIIILFSQYSYGIVDIPVNQKSCKYTVSIPNGWDSIPKDTILKRIGQDIIDIALYPREQDGYFNGNYILVSFLPSIKPLAQLPFKKIVSELEAINKQSKYPETDTLQIAFKGMYSKVDSINYHIFTETSIRKNGINTDCLQDLFLTKFGYISLAYYKKNEGKISLQQVVEIMKNSIIVQPDYIYTEPQNHNRFTIKSIVIAICVGILVYLIMTFLTKKKGDKK